MTTRVWKVGIVALVSDLLPGRAVPFSYAAITLPSLSCPVFRRVSDLIICLSSKWGRHDPSLQPGNQVKEGSGCPQSSHPILLPSLLLSFLWVVLMSCATAAFRLSSLLPHLKELHWQLLPKITPDIASLIFLMEREHTFLLHTTRLQYDSGLPTVFWDAKSGNTFPIYSICVWVLYIF